jgi:hypothetical protein
MVKLMDFQAELEKSEDFGDVFEVVKRSVKEHLRKERGGLMLVLADLPLQLGAFHSLGSNSIVMNRGLLDRIVAAGHPQAKVKSFVYSILLHEYLHSLGLVEEEEVRELVRDVSIRTFGADHPAARVAVAGPWSLLEHSPSKDLLLHREGEMQTGRVELIKDFDRSQSASYIS